MSVGRIACSLISWMISATPAFALSCEDINLNGLFIRIPTALAAEAEAISASTPGVYTYRLTPDNANQINVEKGMIQPDGQWLRIPWNSANLRDQKLPRQLSVQTVSGADGAKECEVTLKDLNGQSMLTYWVRSQDAQKQVIDLVLPNGTAPQDSRVGLRGPRFHRHSTGV